MSPAQAAAADHGAGAVVGGRGDRPRGRVR